MKKILLASGDSNTDQNYQSTFHPDKFLVFDKWPEILSKKLDMDFVNLGRSGAGNEYIYNSVLDYISENGHENIGVVMVGWSQSNRKSWYRRNQKKNSTKDKGWENIRVNPNGNLVGWMRTTLNYYLSFQILMERYNLKYKQFSMIKPYEDMLNGLRPSEHEIVELGADRDNFIPYKGDKKVDEELIIETILEYENKLNLDHFIGWPLTKKLGGYSVWNHIKGEKNLYRISEKDDHPSAEGQIKIAEYIYDRLG